MSVVPLKVGHIVPGSVGEPNQELIGKLEEMLVEARSGQMRAAACIVVDISRAIHTDWFGSCDSHDMAAGVGMLQHRFFANMDLDEDA